MEGHLNNCAASRIEKAHEAKEASLSANTSRATSTSAGSILRPKAIIMPTRRPGPRRSVCCTGTRMAMSTRNGIGCPKVDPQTTCC